MPKDPPLTSEEEVLWRALMRIVVALGGNALLKRGEPMTAEVQRANIRVAAKALAPVVTAESARVRSKHAAPGVIEIELESARIRVRGIVDGLALRTVLEVLARR